MFMKEITCLEKWYLSSGLLGKRSFGLNVQNDLFYLYMQIYNDQPGEIINPVGSDISLQVI